MKTCENCTVYLSATPTTGFCMTYADNLKSDAEICSDFEEVKKQKNEYKKV